jgi:hypothetical protein
LIYGGNCSGSKDFKTFYFTQKTLVDKNGMNNGNGGNNGEGGATGDETIST